MKIANFKAASYSGMKVFKPIQYLHVTGKTKNSVISGVKIRARLVNSESGRVDEIIPLVSLDVLGEICSMNEGFFVHSSSSLGSWFDVNIMLHPTSAVYLSNDKFLEVDIEGLDDSVSTTIYGLENKVVDKDFVCRYNKFYMSAGELQKTFSVGGNEDLILPDSSFEEVSLRYSNGSTCTFTRQELRALMMLKNDIVRVPQTNLCMGDIVQEGASQYELCFGSYSMYGLDVSDVVDFTVRRTSASSAFELIMIDTIKD